MKKTLLTDVTVGELSEGFIFDHAENKGLFGWNGKLVIQPEYQRSYLYDKGGKDVAVIESLLQGYPLGLLYFVDVGDGRYEILDGQQRVTSFARFVTMSYPFGVTDASGDTRYFSSLEKEDRDKILNTKLTIYICKGTPEEIKCWFQKINIVGMPLTPQELRNAAYSGPFINKARSVFSNSNSPEMSKWITYLKGNPIRQEILETALSWVSHGDIDKYLALHRQDGDIREMETYFRAVIEWCSQLIEWTGKEIKGLPWNEYYDEFHGNYYDRVKVNEKISELMSDELVTNKKGIFEYVLSGCTRPEVLNIRIFPESIKRTVYESQTSDAKVRGVSNCPLRATGTSGNRTRIYKYEEMDADHVDAWSRGGSSDISNCQMLCKTHNRAKGNR